MLAFWEFWAQLLRGWAGYASCSWVAHSSDILSHYPVTILLEAWVSRRRQIKENWGTLVNSSCWGPRGQPALTTWVSHLECFRLVKPQLTAFSDDIMWNRWTTKLSSVNQRDWWKRVKWLFDPSVLECAVCNNRDPTHTGSPVARYWEAKITDKKLDDVVTKVGQTHTSGGICTCTKWFLSI